MIGMNEFEFSNLDSTSDNSCLSEESSDEEEPPYNIEINTLNEQIVNPNEKCENADSEEVEVLQTKDKNIP